jgi:hypothetical protein
MERAALNDLLAFVRAHGGAVRDHTEAELDAMSGMFAAAREGRRQLAHSPVRLGPPYPGGYDIFTGRQVFTSWTYHSWARLGCALLAIALGTGAAWYLF